MFILKYLQKSTNYRIAIIYRLNIFLGLYLLLWNFSIYSQAIILDENLIELDFTKKAYLISDNEIDLNIQPESTLLKGIDSEYIIKKNSQIESIYYFSVIKKQDKRFFFEISENIIDYIEIYYSNGINFKKIISGTMNPLRERLSADRNFIFEIPFETDRFTNVFIKIKSHRPNIFKLILYSEEGLWNISESRNITLGIYYSFLVVPIFLFLTLYMGSRQIEYLQFFIYVILVLMLHLWIDSTYLYLFDFLSISFNFLYYSNLFLLEWFILYCFINMDVFIEELRTIRKNFIYFFTINLTFFIPLFREEYEIALLLSLFYIFIIFIYMNYIIFNWKKVISLEKKVFSYFWYPIVLGLLIYHIRSYGFFHEFLTKEFIIEFFNFIQIIIMFSFVILNINYPIRKSQIKDDEYNLNKSSNYNMDFNVTSESKETEIINELRQASELQRNLIPTKEKKYPLIEAKYYYEYYMEVGGDFFDIISNDISAVVVYIADASGHGISSALLATMYKICFTNAISKYTSPELIYKEVNLQTSKVLYTQDYLTAFLAVIYHDGSMIYSSAAHRPALIYRKKSNIAEVLYAKGLFLGMTLGKSVNYEERSEQLQIGDRILFYTDGIFSDSIKEIWNTEILMKVFVKSAKKNIEKALQQIVQEWKSYLPDSKAQDDASFLIIEFTGDKQ